MTNASSPSGVDPASQSVLSPETIYRRQEAAKRNRRVLRMWLGVVLIAIFALVLVGGATRLTDSGLSITEWKPIHGVIPPLTAEEWQEEFELYKRIPEYQQINAGMDLAGFKRIFWWEWAHRILARGVGVLFAVPFLVFLVTGRIERRLRWPLFGLFVLGGLQGAIGWWMVASGLSERVDVSQYRLATHLTLACIIFAAIVWVSRGLAPHSADEAPSGLRRFAGLLAAMILVQIYLGGLVAGLDAGLAYNTWPLMDGAFIPTDVLAIEPWWRNIFENPKLVQLDHRLFGYLVWCATLLHMGHAFAVAPGTTHARRSAILFALATVQAWIGIATLLTQVPFDLALAHQGAALILLGFATAHLRGFYGAYPPPVMVRVGTQTPEEKLPSAA
ncbi:COX15/CtaA family protein [Pseudohoeflea coraliihabitans]|uniref:Heme A synthase n=1 Tax=Pseudohoeflea coraliihabitans TaxID=2860393 RepID=A0ABS6WS65_9HYPH|nr:COX15/CtaA family protein [Pseudohoeflea sp. DP4N28-3]MBW3098794.1 COX15/CtaA family protein [Pseudohoeflea sp. DP4N28-3]